MEDLIRFPYVTRPPQQSILSALKQLTLIGALKINKATIRDSRLFSFGVTTNQTAQVDSVLENALLTSFESTAGISLDSSSQGRDPTQITELGTLLSKIPMDPKCAKIMVVASKYGLLHYAIMIVACMSVTEIFDN